MSAHAVLACMVSWPVAVGLGFDHYRGYLRSGRYNSTVNKPATPDPPTPLDPHVDRGEDGGSG